MKMLGLPLGHQNAGLIIVVRARAAGFWKYLSLHTLYLGMNISAALGTKPLLICHHHHEGCQCI